MSNEHDRQHTLQHILSEIQTLHHTIERLHDPTAESQTLIEAMLRRRSIREVKYTPRKALILPEHCSQAAKDALYQLMKKYSFRLFLRDLIRHIEHVNPEKHLTRYCSEQTAQRYLSQLIDYGIIQSFSSKRYRFVSDMSQNFGDTLEWFVAAVMEKEFDSPATWGNRLKQRGMGGDYDVIACVENRLVYIEVKSSPPKHIEVSEIQAFMDRVCGLRPNIAIFLEDTHLRMKDKLAVMFTHEMRRRYGEQADQSYSVHRLHEEIFTIQNRIFLTNTKPDLITNLETCLAHFLGQDMERASL